MLTAKKIRLNVSEQDAATTGDPVRCAAVFTAPDNVSAC